MDLVRLRRAVRRGRAVHRHDVDAKLPGRTVIPGERVRVRLAGQAHAASPALAHEAQRRGERRRLEVIASRNAIAGPDVARVGARAGEHLRDLPVYRIGRVRPLVLAERELFGRSPLAVRCPPLSGEVDDQAALVEARGREVDNVDDSPVRGESRVRGGGIERRNPVADAAELAFPRELRRLDGAGSACAGPWEPVESEESLRVGGEQRRPDVLADAVAPPGRTAALVDELAGRALRQLDLVSL